MQVKIGDRAKFKDYRTWSDWESHIGQSCIIVQRITSNSKFDWAVRWEDGFVSYVDDGNLIIEQKYKDVIMIREENIDAS